MTYRDKVESAEAEGRWYCRTCDATFTGDKAVHFAGRYHKDLLTFRTERHMAIDPLDLVDLEESEAVVEPPVGSFVDAGDDRFEAAALGATVHQAIEEMVGPRPSGLSVMVEAVGHVLDSESMGYVEAHRIGSAILARLNSGGYVLVKKSMGPGFPLEIDMAHVSSCAYFGATVPVGAIGCTCPDKVER